MPTSSYNTGSSYSTAPTGGYSTGPAGYNTVSSSSYAAVPAGGYSTGATGTYNTSHSYDYEDVRGVDVRTTRDHSQYDYETDPRLGGPSAPVATSGDTYTQTQLDGMSHLCNVCGVF